MQYADWRRDSGVSTHSLASSGKGKVKHNRVLVAVRARPLNGKELELGDREVWRFHGSRIEELDDDGTSPTRGGKSYEYDKVFDPEATTKEIFEHQCMSVTQSALEGYNGTIFAYGQTSSGKTFTLTETSRSNPGIAIQAMDCIFNKVASSHSEYEIHVSYLEIYNESLADLLQKKSSKKSAAKQLRITEDKRLGPVVQDVTEMRATSQAQCLSIYHEGEKNRTTASTDMNERSSRAHTLLRLRIQSRSSSHGADGGDSAEHMQMVAREFMTFQGKVKADRASLFIVDREAEELYTQAGEITLRLPMSEGIAGSVAATGYKENIKEAYEDPRFNAAVDKSTGYTTRSILCMPFLDSQGTVLGVVQFINKMMKPGEVDPRGFDIADENKVLELCQTIGPRVVKAEKAAQVSSFSWFNVVDLAGSERVKKTNTSGATLKEAAYINTSLMMLGTVVSQLTEKTTQHISYRNSKLTHLLSTSLGGNANTSLICTISPAARNRSETHSTLQFASRAIQIVNTAKQNVQVDHKTLVKAYELEIARMKEELMRANMRLNRVSLGEVQGDLMSQSRRPASPHTPRSASEGELGQIFGPPGNNPEDQLSYFARKLAQTMLQERADAFLQDVAESLRLAREANDTVSKSCRPDESIKFEADIAGVRRPFATVRLLKTGKHDLTGTESVAILQSWSTTETKAKLDKIRSSPSFLGDLVMALHHHGFTSQPKNVDESALSPETKSHQPDGSDFGSPSRGLASVGSDLPAGLGAEKLSASQPAGFSARNCDSPISGSHARLTPPSDTPAGHWLLSPRMPAPRSEFERIAQQSSDCALALQTHGHMQPCFASEACIAQINMGSRINMRHTVPARLVRSRSASPGALGQKQSCLYCVPTSQNAQTVQASLSLENSASGQVDSLMGSVGSMHHALPQQAQLTPSYPSPFGSVQAPAATLSAAQAHKFSPVVPQIVAPFSLPISQLSRESTSRASSPLHSPAGHFRPGSRTPPVCLSPAPAYAYRTPSQGNRSCSPGVQRHTLPAQWRMVIPAVRSAAGVHQGTSLLWATRCKNHKGNTRFCHCPSCTAERLSPTRQ
eukprot:TRINITY_DN13453_c0_g2_i4.p1 TRINITY_DN13453_c0_g2~~TRINITY_DN13453_c0_g2_i4.p1  ORF type:complete len:1080 (-),score=151.44 TRINITY_DN13453_c0_g2_i4:165-3404(-)